MSFGASFSYLLYQDMEHDIIHIEGAPVRLHIYSWWESNLVRFSKSLVVSLGAKAVR